jgi:4-amino-4-deoxy-L-arabinose transferase-like glycosyltransferase
MSMLFWKRISTKNFKFDSYTLAAATIIVIAVALRVTLVALGWPPLDSDEATMGLMGMHIAFHGEWPIFFYGQGYMGAFEAYLAAIMFRLFGVSTFTLLLGLILMYTLFLIAMYRLTCLLYSKSLALITLVFLCLGSNPLLTRELVSIGGYPETLMFGSILMLLSSWLVLHYNPDVPPSEQRRRLWVYGAWGLVAGLGIWTHVLVAPFVLLGGILLLLFCWRELLGWSSICLVVALLIGALPMIIYNVYASPGQSTLSYILHVHSASGITLPPKHILYLLQLKGALLISLPLATGATPLCSPSQISFSILHSIHIVLCTFTYTAWSLGIIVLWILAAAFTLYQIWRVWSSRPYAAEERRLLVVSTARLALLATSALTFLLYVISPDSALFSVPTSRYLVGVLVSTPAILWPLWSGTSIVKPLLLKFPSRPRVAMRLSRLSFVIRRVVLVGIGLALLIGTQSIFTGIPSAPPVAQRWGRFAIQVNDQHLDLADTRKLDQQQYELIDNLLRIGAVHIYSDYWTCDRLIFQSRERIICYTLKDNLFTGQNRYLPYLNMVRADKYSAYVFLIGSPPATQFARITRRSQSRYQHFVFDGYVVYQPKKPLSEHRSVPLARKSAPHHAKTALARNHGKKTHFLA